MFEPVGAVKAMGRGVRRHDGHANFLDQGPGMRDDPLHQRRRQSAAACPGANIHSPQDALVPELGGAIHVETGHAEQRRIIDPASEHGAGFQPLGPPRGGLGRLVISRSAERFGVALQTFKAQLAIARDIRRFETTHLEDLLRDGGVGLGHGYL